MLDPFGETPEQQERRAAQDGALLFAVVEDAGSSPRDREEPADPEAVAIDASDRYDSIGGVDLQSSGQEGEFDALALARELEKMESEFNDGKDLLLAQMGIAPDELNVAMDQEPHVLAGDADRHGASPPVDRGRRSPASGAPPAAAFGRPNDGGAPAIAAAFSRPYGGGVGPARPARLSRALPRQKWRRMALLGGGFALLVVGGATVAVLSGRRPNAAPISETSEHEITESGDPSGMHQSGLFLTAQPAENIPASGKHSPKAKELVAVDGLVVLPKPLEPGDSIKVSGTGGPATLNLLNDDRSEIILEFNPRGGENVIVRNSRYQNAWNHEEIRGGYPFALTDGTWDFELVAESNSAVGMVVDGTRFGKFHLRREHKISDVTKLTINTSHPKQDKPTEDFKVFFTPAEVND